MVDVTSEVTDAPADKRTVVVTDAQRGVGRATALRLVEHGFCVLACGRDLSGMGDMPRETASGGLLDIAAFGFDDDASCQLALERARELFGRLDAVVHTGMAAHFGAAEETDEAVIQRVFATNFFVPLRMIRASAAIFRVQRRGTIVCVSSAAGRVALPMSAVASASHHALEGLCDAMRLELRSFGVDVVLVEPGIVREGVVVEAANRVEQALGGVAAQSPYAGLAEALREVVRELAQQASTPRAVADVIVRALMSPRPKPRYAITRRAAAWLWARKVLPDRVRDNRLAKAMRLPRPPGVDKR